MTPTAPRSATPRAWPLLADLVCVLALAVGGLRSHDPDGALVDVLVIGWPFALAAGSAHLLLGMRGRPTRRVWPEGALVVAGTYLLGMALRALSGRGLAAGFLVVAAVFLVLTMLGWRAAVQLVARSRVRRS